MTIIYPDLPDPVAFGRAIARQRRRGTWDEISVRCGTDKSSSGHDYMQHYQRSLVGRDVRAVLEIGVDAGASLCAWADIFPAAQIVGVDIRPECAQYASNRVEIVIGDATDAHAMAHLTARSWDLIIDDGSHRLADIATTLGLFAGSLRRGGMYAIEDTIIDGNGWPAPTRAVLPLLKPLGLSLHSLIRSKLDFVAGDVNYGKFGLILADRP